MIDHCPLDQVGRVVDRLMFPDTQYGPTQRAQSARGVAIAGTIVSNLLAPPLGVALRLGAVTRTSVPEAAVEEDCYP
jgi:hypothetical protein